MFGQVIRRYGPTTMLIVIAVLLGAAMGGADRRIDALQSFNRQRLDALGGRLGSHEGRQETRFDALEAYLETRLRGIEQAQVALRKRMDLVGNKVEAIGDQLEGLAALVSAPPEVAGPAE